MSSCGSVLVALSHDSHVNRMSINVKEARDLPSRERGGVNQAQIRTLLLPLRKVGHAHFVLYLENVFLTCLHDGCSLCMQIHYPKTARIIEIFSISLIIHEIIKTSWWAWIFDEGFCFFYWFRHQNVDNKEKWVGDVRNWVESRWTKVNDREQELDFHYYWIEVALCRRLPLAW